MAKQWFIRIQDRTYGPYQASQLKQLAKEGRISRKDSVRKGEDGDWVQATSVTGLFIDVDSASKITDSKASEANNAETVLPPEALPPINQSEVTQPAKDSSSPESSSSPSIPNRMTLLIGGGLTFIAVSLIALTLIIGLIGAAYFRQTGDEAVAQEKLRLEQDAEAKEAEAKTAQAEAEREAWLQANFDSELAKRIRKNAPTFNSPLQHQLVNYRMESIPSEWSNQSPTVQGPIFTGSPGYGSPFLIDDRTLALVIPNKGLHFELWHVDTKSGAVRKVTEHKTGPASGKYHSVTWHNTSAGDLLGQFVHLETIERKFTPKFKGVGTFGWLNLRTGEKKGQVIKDGTNRDQEFLIEELMKPQLPRTTRVTLTNGANAIKRANANLKNVRLTFDVDKAELQLNPEVKKSWNQELSNLKISSARASSKINVLSNSVNSAPDCPITRQLRPALQFAKAAVNEDKPALKAYVQGNSGHYMKPFGTMEFVHLIASKGDRYEDYMKFQEFDPGTAARDLAILRIHEIAFTVACEDATISTFDDFLISFPGSKQWEKAFKNAYDLELERARFEVEHASDKDKKLEQVANSFFVRWRDNLRDENMVVAQRMWDILSDEPDFNQTKAATKAQTELDRDIYREKMLTIQRERNRILASIDSRLAEVNSNLRQINSTLIQTNAMLGQIGQDILTSSDQHANSMDQLASEVAKLGR